ncbi:SDR family oxidoreductase [Auraticoccus monumenti]|uniref:Short-chain dehydrogenase n=1 Tax=Auraticoccus monumenti TaxID=675864 RepID=A0A1G6WSE6_9ACTN|nr:SDR family oxidoreductase [Auraticoccus monumenti]SDD67965.1 Short-chain dehydrogenase [Auraticoccus monumenti]
MKVTGSTALVTGANRGIGRAVVEELLARGATKVYAAARRPELVDVPGVVPLRLDITDDDQVLAAAAAAPDVTLLVNNAGIALPGAVTAGDLEPLRRELDTHLWGTLSVVRAFAPALRANGGGAISNVLSAMSWFTIPGMSGYHISKAAAWAMTNGIRLELADQGTLVSAVHIGAVDTDFSAHYDGHKIPAADVANALLDGIEAGTTEVLVDDWTRAVKAALPQDATAYAVAALAGG